MSTLDWLSGPQNMSECIIGEKISYPFRESNYDSSVARGPEQRSRYSYVLRPGRSGDRIPVGGGARFSALAQTGPRAHPASSTMVTGSFQGVKRPECGFDHPTIQRRSYKRCRALPLLLPFGLFQRELHRPSSSQRSMNPDWAILDSLCHAKHQICRSYAAGKIVHVLKS